MSFGVRQGWVILVSDRFGKSIGSLLKFRYFKSIGKVVIDIKISAVSRGYKSIGQKGIEKIF